MQECVVVLIVNCGEFQINTSKNACCIQSVSRHQLENVIVKTLNNVVVRKRQILCQGHQ